MAAAASSSALASSEEKTNGAKLSRLLIDGGTTVLRSVFDSYHPPANLAADLNASYSILINLLRRRILNGHQLDKLFPPGGAAPDSNTFDITLLFLLLTNICGLSPPLSGWHSKPPQSDTSREANLARIKFFRNQLYGHVAATGVDTPTFNALWQEISAVLVALGLGQAEIDRLKAERGGEQDYLDALRDWAESEEDIKTQLKDIRYVQSSTQQTVKGIKCKFEEIHQIEKKTHEVATNIHRAQEEDRSSIQKGFSKLDQDVQELHQVHFADHKTLQYTKTKVEEMSQTVKGNKCKLEEVCQVFTEICQTQVNEDQEDEIVLKKLAKVDTDNDVRYYSDRYLEGTRESVFGKVDSWLDDRSSPNRVMVISGNAGMGKSVIAAEMCKRMQEAGRLSGSHFCRHDKARHRNPKVMLQSLATHLSCCLPEYKKSLVAQLSRNLVLDINDMEVADLFELLFELPLNTLEDPGFISLVVIDGLDESEYQGRNDLVDMIAKYFNKLPLWIRFLVTTRPEINIVEKLKSLQPLLLEPNDEENLKDIRIYFKHQVSDMLHAENHDLILEDLVEKSEGVILCAQFLVDFIKKNFSILTLEQLESTLPSGISSVYQSYFKHLETDLCKELKITEDEFFSFLSAITVSREPLPLGFVSKLLFPSTLSPAVQRKVNQAIACISSLLPVHNDCIHFFHKSVKDWLTDEAFYGQHNFNVNKSEGHWILSRLCIDEFDVVKRKGVDASQPFSDTAKYALQHGVQHMLQLNDDARSYSLDEVASNYVLDIELAYAKLCVNSTTATEEILCVMRQEGLNSLSVEMQNALGNFLFLFRKHNTTLEELSSTIFQTLLNEGGPELSSEASKLLEAKYSNLSYLEYLNKNDLRGAVQTTFYCSSQVACFDVSPQSDYMVCECRDGTIQLWSLHTGKLVWKRPVIELKQYPPILGAFRTSEPIYSVFVSSQWFKSVLSYFRSVVFHPTEDVILPGVLSHAYSFDGDLNRPFPESKCRFTVCSISGDKILTDCPDDAKCLIMWSLTDGREISRLTRDEDVLSFAWSKDRRLLAISHSSGSVCLVDVMNGFKTLAETTISNACGMIKFSPDHRFLFCWYYPLGGISLGGRLFCFDINMENHDTFSFDVSSNSVSYEPWNFEARTEGGFALGDPISCLVRQLGPPTGVLRVSGTFAFVLNKHSVLRINPGCDSITMLFSDELRRDGYDLRRNAVVGKLVFSVNGETIYVLSGDWDEEFELTAWNVSTEELKGRKRKLSVFAFMSCPVAVRQGILLRSGWDTLELWNFELSQGIRRWTLEISLGISGLFPISDQHIVCTYFKRAIILDTTGEDRLTVTERFCGKLVACNSKLQLITFDDGVLRSIQGAVWKKPFFPRDSPAYCLSLAGMFSPTEEFLVISHSSDLTGNTSGVYVLDPLSGNTRHILCEAKQVNDYKFVSDEACVIHTYDPACGFRLQLFNLRSGDLLSLLDIDSENQVHALGSCPRKGLIAIGLISSEIKFKLIEVKLPGTTGETKGTRWDQASRVSSD